jgi:rRNA maturation endonuclease Nob1
MTWHRLSYHPVTKKKLKPIIKFNNGRGAILCHKCRKIIKENLTLKEFAGKTTELFCFECGIELLIKTFKHTKHDEK